MVKQSSGRWKRESHSVRFYVASWCLMGHFVTRSAKYQYVWKCSSPQQQHWFPVWMRPEWCRSPTKKNTGCYFKQHSMRVSNHPIASPFKQRTACATLLSCKPRPQIGRRQSWTAVLKQTRKQHRAWELSRNPTACKFHKWLSKTLVHNKAGPQPVVTTFAEDSLAISSFLRVIWSASFSLLHFLLNFGPSEPFSSQELIVHYNFLSSILSGWPDVLPVISAPLFSETVKCLKQILHKKTCMIGMTKAYWTQFKAWINQTCG